MRASTRSSAPGSARESAAADRRGLESPGRFRHEVPADAELLARERADRHRHYAHESGFAEAVCGIGSRTELAVQAFGVRSARGRAKGPGALRVTGVTRGQQ